MKLKPIYNENNLKFEWEDSIFGKKCFVSMYIQEIIESVLDDFPTPHTCASWQVEKSDKEGFAFRANICNEWKYFRFCYVLN